MARIKGQASFIKWIQAEESSAIDSTVVTLASDHDFLQTVFVKQTLAEALKSVWR